MDVLDKTRTLSDLPPEMMEKIFEHLTFHERLTISGTCKLWHQLIFGTQFCKRLFLHVGGTQKLVVNPFAREMFERCRNIVIEYSELEADKLELLKNYMSGISLELLKIWAVKKAPKRIVETLLEVVPELKTLHLIQEGHPSWNSNATVRIKHQNLSSIVLYGRGHYEIECAKDIVLECDQMHGKTVRINSGHLRSFKLCILDDIQHDGGNLLSSFHWDHLEELSLTNPPPTDVLENILKQMPQLKNLSLYNSQSNSIFTGEEIKAATRLSELTLGEKCIDAVSLNNNFLDGSSLQSISLLSCTFCSPDSPLESRFIKRLSFQPLVENLMPLFPRLEVLDILGTDATHFRLLLWTISQRYPELERLTFEVKPGQIGKFEPPLEPTTESPEETASNPFSSLNKLHKLKVLKIGRMDLTRIDWTTCEGSRVEHIRLQGCHIDGEGTEKLVQAFRHLRTFYLDNCCLRQPRAALFHVSECSRRLRSLARHCKISYYDVRIDPMNEFAELCKMLSMPRQNQNE